MAAHAAPPPAVACTVDRSIDAVRQLFDLCDAIGNGFITTAKAVELAVMVCAADEDRVRHLVAHAADGGLLEFDGTVRVLKSLSHGTAAHRFEERVGHALQVLREKARVRWVNQPQQADAAGTLEALGGDVTVHGLYMAASSASGGRLAREKLEPLIAALAPHLTHRERRKVVLAARECPARGVTLEEVLELLSRVAVAGGAAEVLPRAVSARSATPVRVGGGEPPAAGPLDDDAHLRALLEENRKLKESLENVLPQPYGTAKPVGGLGVAGLFSNASPATAGDTAAAAATSPSRSPEPARPGRTRHHLDPHATAATDAVGRVASRSLGLGPPTAAGAYAYDLNEAKRVADGVVHGVLAAADRPYVLRTSPVRGDRTPRSYRSLVEAGEERMFGGGGALDVSAVEYTAEGGTGGSPMRYPRSTSPMGYTPRTTAPTAVTVLAAPAPAAPQPSGPQVAQVRALLKENADLRLVTDRLRDQLAKVSQLKVESGDMAAGLEEHCAGLESELAAERAERKRTGDAEDLLHQRIERMQRQIDDLNNENNALATRDREREQRLLDAEAREAAVERLLEQAQEQLSTKDALLKETQGHAHDLQLRLSQAGSPSPARAASQERERERSLPSGSVGDRSLHDEHVKLRDQAAVALQPNGYDPETIYSLVTRYDNLVVMYDRRLSDTRRKLHQHSRRVQQAESEFLRLASHLDAQRFPPPHLATPSPRGGGGGGGSQWSASPPAPGSATARLPEALEQLHDAMRMLSEQQKRGSPQRESDTRTSQRRAAYNRL